MSEKDTLWKRTFAFRLKDGDEMISEFIQSSNKSESDTIRELLRFAINEVKRAKTERTLDKRFKQLEETMQELIRLQEGNHKELIDLIKSGVVVSDNEIESEKEHQNSSIDSSIDSVLNMFDV